MALAYGTSSHRSYYATKLLLSMLTILNAINNAYGFLNLNFKVQPKHLIHLPFTSLGIDDYVLSYRT